MKLLSIHGHFLVSDASYVCKQFFFKFIFITDYVISVLLRKCRLRLSIKKVQKYLMDILITRYMLPAFQCLAAAVSISGFYQCERLRDSQFFFCTTINTNCTSESFNKNKK